MYYSYIDGDDIGLKIEKCLMDNDEISLIKVNNDVKDIISKITVYLEEKGINIIFSGADGIICKGELIDHDTVLQYIRKISNKYTFSIGISINLKGAFLALRYAKAMHKNTSVIYENDSFHVYN